MGRGRPAGSRKVGKVDVKQKKFSRFLAGVTVGFFLGLVLSAFRLCTNSCTTHTHPLPLATSCIQPGSRRRLGSAPHALCRSTAIEVISVAFFKSSLVTGFIAAFALNMTGYARGVAGALSTLRFPTAPPKCSISVSIVLATTVREIPFRQTIVVRAPAQEPVHWGPALRSPGTPGTRSGHTNA